MTEHKYEDEGESTVERIQVGWPAYNETNGETRVATGDVDGDGKDELVVGYGMYTDDGGWIRVLDDSDHGCAVLTNLPVGWAAYNAATGRHEWPAAMLTATNHLSLLKSNLGDYLKDLYKKPRTTVFITSLLGSLELYPRRGRLLRVSILEAGLLTLSGRT